ncbi:MAG: hypothetical protein ACM3XR_10205 [Bacillota bacterium]
MRAHRNNRRNNGVIFFVTFVVLAAAAVFIAVVMRPESAAELYFTSEKRNLERMFQEIDRQYSDFMAKQKPYLENPHRRRIELTLDIKSGIEIFSKKSDSQLGDIIKTSKLVIDTVRSSGEESAPGGVSAPEEASASKETSATKVSLLVRKSPFIDLELFTRGGNLFCSIPVLMPGRYFSARLDQLDEVYDKFSVPVKPKKFLNKAAVAKALKFDKSAFTESGGKLAGIFKKYITGDNVKYGRDREVTISGTTVKGKEVVVTIGKEAATSLLRELASTAGGNSLLLEYTYGNAAALSQLLDDAGFFRLAEYLDKTGIITLGDHEKSILSGLNLDKDVKGFADSLKMHADNYSLENGFNMVLVIDGSKNIIDRKLTLEFAGTGDMAGVSYTLEINTGSSNTAFEDIRNRFVNIVLTEHAAGGTNAAEGSNAAGGADAAAAEGSNDTGKTGAAGGAKTSGEENTFRSAPVKTTEFSIIPSFKKTAGAETDGSVDISYVVKEGASVTGFDLNMEILDGIDGETKKRNRITRYRTDIFGDAGEGTVEGDIDSYYWENKKLNTKNYTSKIDLDVNLPFRDVNNFSATLYLAGEDRFIAGEPELPGLDRENVIDLNVATQKDIERIKIEALASFGELYFSNKELFDGILGQ